jgi:YggT family protein
MFVAGNVIEGLAHVLDAVLTIYMWIIVARAVISWVNPDPYNWIVQILIRATEPVLFAIRRRLGYGMGIDFSPIIAILIIVFLQIALVRSLFELAARMH